MLRMFGICSDFSQNVQTFQTMLIMFRHCSDNVQNVRNLFGLFSECSDFSDNVNNVQTLFRQCSECISYNLEFHNFPGDNTCTLPSPPSSTYQRGKPPSQALPHLRLQHSVRASGTQLSLYFINWDRQLSWQNQPQNISSARRIEKC
jgi:hypothetical protein